MTFDYLGDWLKSRAHQADCQPGNPRQKSKLKKVVLLVITKFKDEITEPNTSLPLHHHHSLHTHSLQRLIKKWISVKLIEEGGKKGGEPNSPLSTGLFTSWNKFLQFYNKLFFLAREMFSQRIFSECLMILIYPLRERRGKISLSSRIGY